MTKPQAALYNGDTREVIRRAEARSWVILLAFMVLLVAGGLAYTHHEWPVLDYRMGNCSPEEVLSDCVSRGRTSLLVGIFAALLLIPPSVLIHRRRPIRPTITCDDCGGRGWAMDLEPRNGRCPRCAHSFFTYRAFVWRGYGIFGVQLIIERGRTGTELVERFHRTRRSALNRYY